MLRLLLASSLTFFAVGCSCRGAGLKPIDMEPDAGCTPSTEVCNGKDDDCDGVVDDVVGEAATCGVGECARKAILCDHGFPGTCTPGTPTAEVCNGKDDDCDGQTDEDLMPAMCGQGECATVSSTCVAGVPSACMPLPPKAEVCNGKDDDCNGSVDEGLVTNLTPDIRVTNDPAASDYVYAGWNGKNFALAWSDKRDGAGQKGEIYVATLDAFGARVTPDTRITTTTGASTHPALAWDGTGYGLVYADDTPGNPELYFQHLDATGKPQGASVRLTNATGNSVWPDLVWTGTEFAVAWEDSRAGAANTDIYFQRVDAQGKKVGPEVKVTTDGSRQNSPILKWDGTGFGLAWTDSRNTDRQVYFAKLSATGQRVGGEVNVSATTFDAAWPDLSYSGSDWAVVWHDARFGSGNTEVYLQRLNATGAKQGAAVRLSQANGFSGYASIDWNGYEYGVSWQDDRGGSPTIYFAQVSAQGQKNGAEKKLSNGTGAASFTTALWNGKTFGFAWRDERDGPSGNSEIYFAQVGCP